MKYRLAVFDMDGTVLDTLPDLADTLNVVYARLGYPGRTYEQVRMAVGNGLRRLIEQTIPEGTDADTIDEVCAEYAAHYKHNDTVKTKPYDGITEAIERLRSAGVKTAVVSNKADFAVRDLCGVYFPGLFDAYVGERKGIRRKPAPDSVLEVLRMLGIEAKDAVYVGDSEVDLETAAACGMDCVAVSWGYKGRAFLEEMNAPLIIDRPDELDGCVL